MTRIILSIAAIATVSMASTDITLAETTVEAENSFFIEFISKVI
ncbi:MAG: hypothetical protein U9O24_04840 [Campylobacterota bacterium]|nr:hypothetical protein [Campylobacterota bacterium]